MAQSPAPAAMDRTTTRPEFEPDVWNVFEAVWVRDERPRDVAARLRRPATYCSVVGLRPSAGRVTRGTSNNLFAPLSVQGPMARNVADLALFLDAMVGLCPHDPLTFDAPGQSFSSAVAAPVAPKRVAFTADFAGKVPVDREMRDICSAAVRRFEDLGVVVEEASPDLGNIAEAFLTLRSQHYLVDRELMLQTHRDLIKPDIVWNTELGLKQSPSQIAAAERERATQRRLVLRDHRGIHVARDRAGAAVDRDRVVVLLHALREPTRRDDRDHDENDDEACVHARAKI